MAVNLQMEKIIDRWAVMLQGAAGKGNWLFDEIEKYLLAATIPSISWQMDAHIIPPLGRYPGKRTDYLVVSNANLQDYRHYISARDYGIYLDVTRVLAVESNTWSKTFAKIVPAAGMLMSSVLDFDSEQELSAYKTIVHNAVLSPVETLMKDLNQDFSKINTRSRGVLDSW